MVNVRKRGNFYQYQFEVAPINGKRKQITKSGFKTKAEAEKAGIIAFNNYDQTGHSFKPATISYSDYLDYWVKEHCKINLKYHTIQAYENIIKNHIKPRVGFYRLSQITTSTLQEFINNTYVEYGFSKNFMKNIIKVLKTSFSYATDVVGFVKENPALKVKLPRYDMQDSDPAHIFSKEEVATILERFKKNHCVYYAFLTAYYTGLRVSEVFGLTWDDIDFESKTLTVNRNILKKNQASATHGRKEYDEVNIMKNYAIEKGIPSENIFMDHAGFSTYESIYRAKDIFQAKKVVIVTQKYHLYRALYIANRLGLEAYGVGADPRQYVGATYREIREILARDKDFIKCIFKPEPTYLGDTIPVSGNGDITNDGKQDI